MVPKDWDRRPLCDVAEIRTGVAKGKKNLKNPIEVPYLRVANVQDGHLDLTEVKTIQIERSQLVRYSLKVGDVLMTEGGDFDKLGRGDVWNGEIAPCLNQNHVFAVRVNTSKIIPYYLTSLSGSHYGKSYFLRCAKKSTNLASINSTQLKEFPVLIPPVVEQTKIAQILSTWDKAIETVEKLIENSQQQKKALMQQLLTGKKRFLGFDGLWKSSYLTELATIIVSSVDKKIFGDEIPIKLCNYTDVYYNNFITKKISFMKASAKQAEIDKCTLLIGDVVITKDSETPGDIAVPALVTEDLDGVLCGYHLAIIRTDHKLADGGFLNCLFSTPKTRYYFFTLASGATRFGLSIGSINNAQFNLPSIDEQRKIASVFLTKDKELSTLAQKLNHLKQEKKALMQQLLTGKRRVKLNQEETP